jgi:hypothetical protein
MQVDGLIKDVSYILALMALSKNVGQIYFSRQHAESQSYRETYGEDRQKNRLRELIDKAEEI